jgi:hypothetical protein
VAGRWMIARGRYRDASASRELFVVSAANGPWGEAQSPSLRAGESTLRSGAYRSGASPLTTAPLPPSVVCEQIICLRSWEPTVTISRRHQAIPNSNQCS